MGKTRIIAETGAGQHGVATATVCALLGLDCVVYMGTEDMRAPGPERRPDAPARRRGARRSTRARRTLKDAINEAMRDWVTNVRDDALHPRLGPRRRTPIPAMVRDFQAVIGREARAQMLEADGRLPDAARRLRRRRHQRDRPLPRLSRGRGRADGRRRGRRASASARRARRALLPDGRAGLGVLHGTRTYLLQDDGRQGAADALRLGRPRLPGGRSRARAPARRGPRRVRLGPGRRGARRVPPPGARPRASCPPSSRPTRSPGSSARRPRFAASRSSST